MSYSYARIQRRLEPSDNDCITFGIVLFKNDKIVYHYEDVKLWNRINTFTKNKIPHQKLDFIGVSYKDWLENSYKQNSYLKYNESKIISINFNKKSYDTLKQIFIDKYYNTKK